MKSSGSNEQRILSILLDGKLHHASEFIVITHRFSVCMQRLKEKGYNIQTFPLDGQNKAAWYQLIVTSVAA